jgi:hypothetical protein
MPVQIDRVDTEIEIQRKAEGGAPGAASTGGGEEVLASLRGQSALRERLRPMVLEIVRDELNRIKRKVGSP